jgi:hypothetical protein
LPFAAIDAKTSDLNSSGVTVRFCNDSTREE